MWTVKETVLNLALLILTIISGANMNNLSWATIYKNVGSLLYNVAIFVGYVVKRLELQALAETLLVCLSTSSFFVLEQVVKILSVLFLGELLVKTLNTTVWVWNQITTPFRRILDFFWYPCRRLGEPSVEMVVVGNGMAI